MGKKNKSNDEYSLDQALAKLAKVAKDSQASITIGSTETSVTSNSNPQNYSSQTTPDLSSTHVPLLASMTTSIDGIRTDLCNTKDLMHGNVEKLRTEIETKLDNKLDNIYFWGAVSVLGLVGIIIFTLSYSPLLDRVNSFDQKFVNKSFISPLEDKINSNSAFINSKNNFVSKSEFNSLKTIVNTNKNSIKQIATDTNGT